MEVPIPLKSLSVKQLKNTIKENKDKLIEQGIMQSLQGNQNAYAIGIMCHIFDFIRGHGKVGIDRWPTSCRDPAQDTGL